MVFKFRLLSHEIKDFVRDIEIKSSQTFFDFHKAIQDDLNYDSSQIASFFLTNQLWEKEKEFILFDMSDVPNNKMIAMDLARLRDYVKDPKQRLIYTFDIFNERCLFIELIDSQNELNYFDYPAIVFSKGIAPQQILFGNRDYGAILDDDNASFNFNNQYDEDAQVGLPGELDTNEDEDGDFNEDMSSDFGEDGELSPDE